VETYAHALTAQNALALFSRYDVVIDGTDNFPAKFLINDAAVKSGMPFVYGSILGFDGHVASFALDGSPCYRCLFPAPPKGHIPNCAEAGVIGAVAGIIGTTQAMEALKIILQNSDLPPLSGKLWTIDLRSMKNTILTLPKNPDCPVCSKEKETIMLHDTPKICAIPERAPEEIKQDNIEILLDVREAHEWDAGHIEGAQHFALSRLVEGEFPDLPRDRPIVLYCRSGFRSKQAAALFQARGYTALINLAGGYEAWCDSVA